MLGIGEQFRRQRRLEELDGLVHPADTAVVGAVIDLRILGEHLVAQPVELPGIDEVGVVEHEVLDIEAVGQFLL